MLTFVHLRYIDVLCALLLATDSFPYSHHLCRRNGCLSWRCMVCIWHFIIGPQFSQSSLIGWSSNPCIAQNIAILIPKTTKKFWRYLVAEQVRSALTSITCFSTLSPHLHVIDVSSQYNTKHGTIWAALYSSATITLSVLTLLPQVITSIVACRSMYANLIKTLNF